MIGLFQELEQEVIGDIARRIKKTERYTETAEIMAKAMAEQGFSASKIRADVMRHMRADAEYQRLIAENTKEYKAYVKSAIKETVEKAKKNGSEMAAAAGTMSYNDDLSMWEQAGKDLSVPNSMSQIAEAAAKQTAARFQNLAKTAGFRNTAFASTGIMDLYQKEVDMALLKTAAGTFSYGQAVNDCIHRLARSGLRSIDYESGRSYQLDTAVRMSVRTGLSQMSGRITEENIKSTGVDLVITSQHAGSRPEHVPWQNQIFSYNGNNKKYPDFVSSTGYGSAGGLKGVNCTHSFYPFWEGISKIPEDIKEPDPVTIDGKEYTYNQAQQRQRRMERGIRAVKREIEAQKAIGGDTRVLSARLRMQTADYKKFSVEAGLRAKTDRLRVQGGTSDIKKTKYYQGTMKGYAKAAKGDKMELEIQFFAEKSEHAKERMSERTVSDSAIKDALENPLHKFEPKIDSYGRKSIKYIGKDATVCLNPDTDVVITTWKTGKKTVKKYERDE